MFNLPRIDSELKALIPPLADEEREQLEQNILSKRKCHNAIILWDGIIIDGHNRYEICVKHGIEFKVEEMSLPSREAAKVWILENQLGRRNLNDAMRIEVALMKAEMLRKMAQKKQAEAGGDKRSDKATGSLLSKGPKPPTDSIHVQKAAASDAKVGEGTFYRYMEVKDHGSPELLAGVQSGQMKIGTAHRLLAKEILKQLSRADKMYNFLAKAIPPQGLKAANPDLYNKLANLSVTLKELINRLDEGGHHDTANN